MGPVESLIEPPSSSTFKDSRDFDEAHLVTPRLVGDQSPEFSNPHLVPLGAAWFLNEQHYACRFLGPGPRLCQGQAERDSTRLWAGAAQCITMARSLWVSLGQTMWQVIMIVIVTD